MQVIKQMFGTTAGARAGILILPDDIATNPDKVPLIVFSHGTGEAGDGTLGTVDTLYNNGSPLALARDGKLNAIIDPVTGKTVRFAAFGLQGVRGWCVQAVDQIGTIQAILAQYPNLDAKAVVKTGLSAGGQVTWEAIGGPSGDMFLAGVPMSTPTTNPLTFPKYTAKTWVFHGAQDNTGQTNIQNSINNTDYANGVKNASTFLTTYNGNHCCWATYYDPANKIKTPDNSGSKTVSIYEWVCILRNTPGYLFTSSGTQNGITGLKPIITQPTKAIAYVNIVNGTATLDPSHSTLNGGNDSGSSVWFVTPKIGYTDGRSDSFALNLKMAAGLSKNATYSIYLQVGDRYGVTNTSPTFTITTDGNASGSGNSEGSVVPIPVPGCSTALTPVDGSTLTTQTTANLSWNAVSGATLYDLYLYTGSTAPATPTVTGIVGTSYAATNLVAGTTYIWFIIPRNGSGPATGCPKTSFQTAPLVVPPVRTLVSTTYIGTKKINVYSDLSVETI